MFAEKAVSIPAGMTQVGYVGVDSGSIWVGDPCYVMGEDSSFGPKDWAEHCRILDEKNYWTQKLNYIEPFGEGIGIEFGTLYGDGAYPVYANVDDNGRVHSIFINFEDEPDEDDVVECPSCGEAGWDHQCDDCTEQEEEIEASQ